MKKVHIIYSLKGLFSVYLNSKKCIYTVLKKKVMEVAKSTNNAKH